MAADEPLQVLRGNSNGAAEPVRRQFAAIDRASDVFGREGESVGDFDNRKKAMSGVVRGFTGHCIVCGEHSGRRPACTIRCLQARMTIATVSPLGGPADA